MHKFQNLNLLGRFCVDHSDNAHADCTAGACYSTWGFATWITGEGATLL